MPKHLDPLPFLRNRRPQDSALRLPAVRTVTSIEPCDQRDWLFEYLRLFGDGALLSPATGWLCAERSPVARTQRGVLA